MTTISTQDTTGLVPDSFSMAVPKLENSLSQDCLPDPWRKTHFIDKLENTFTLGTEALVV
jgi:hypothetical protein